MKHFEVKIFQADENIDDAKAIRTKVFQEEQCISGELDFDGNDHLATHFVVYNNTIPIGTGRIRKIDDSTMKIERVAVLTVMRGLGVGKLIMNKMCEYLQGSSITIITLDAQLHAKGFYDSLEYTQEGEIFIEAGIPHVVMVKKINQNFTI